MHEIAESEASPSVTRVSDAYETAFSFATRKRSTKVDRAKSKALRTFLERRRGYDLSAMCLAFIGFEGSAEHVKAQRKLVAPIVRRHNGVGDRLRPGRALRPEEVRHPVHPRLPARPRRARRRVRDRGAVAGAAEALRRSDGRGARRVRRPRRQRLHHVPPVALLPRGRLPLLHVRDQAVGDARRARASTTRSRARSSRRSSTTAARSRTITPSAPSTRRWLEQDISPAGVGARAGAVRRRRPGGNLNPGKIVPSRARERS